MQAAESTIAPETYQGQFGTFTITDRDRQGVIVYRSALMVAAVSFGSSVLAILSQLGRDDAINPIVLDAITGLFIIFSIALGVALATIHIYMAVLHRLLQLFLAIGSASAIGLSFYYRQPIAAIVYEHSLAILGVGFTFAALTGIFFKEAFCFNRLETKFLTFIVPGLLLGHLFGILPRTIEIILLCCWAALFAIFALRKIGRDIPADIGDKSVFEYLKHKH